MTVLQNIDYKIILSRRRTISIIVSPDKGVIVKAPFRTPSHAIRRFVTEKSEWISKTLEGFNSLIRIDSSEGYKDGDQILLFGKYHTLRLHQATEYYVSLPDNGRIIEAGYAKSNDPVLIRALLERWFKVIAAKKLNGKFRELVARYSDYGFKPSAFSVRYMKKRWGSCSSKGRIAISYDLIRLDEVYAEYVIIHELCHLRHHNHSAEYYRLLSEVYPGWKDVRKELRRYLR
ncbi:MAG TPA: SprT family zinc-dependent metalloprotease [Bacteroidales bacterium]|jgi:predicted metal-dependent hydrolase|nr:SprT family zinc-dependent metalloprotease [Bacteroidales bacterium]